MSFYVGIYPSINYFFVYNSLTKKSTRIPTDIIPQQPIFGIPISSSYLGAGTYSYSPVKVIFDLVKSHVNEKGGYVSVVLEKFDNKLRKEFIKYGLEAGFEKVEIIDFQTARYLHATFYSEYIPSNGDIIWIIHNGLCHVWQKINDKAKYIKSMEGDFSMLNKFLVGDYNDDGIERIFYPTVILYDDDRILLWKFALPCYKFQIFPIPNSSLHHLLKIGTTSLYTAKMGPLVHARLIGNDPELFDYSVVQMLDRQITIRLKNIKENGSKKLDNTIFVVEKSTQLPLQCQIVIRKRREHNKLIIESLKPPQRYFMDLIDHDKLKDTFQTIEEEISLPSCDNLILNLIIDTNGIYTVTIKEMFLENFKDIDEFIDAFYGTFNSKNEEEDQRSLEEIQRYTIPKQISTNNKEINVVGIDLGTTRCCAAVNRKNGIQTVALENTGERLLPSYVAFDEKHIKCGQIVVYRLRNYSEASVFDIKRIIGRRFENLKVDESWTFEVCNDDGKIFIKTEGFNGDILKMTPEDISAELLKYIKHKTEEFQGQKLFEAVITVPAAFDEAQRKATIEAANLAGWETVQLLPEPVAAAFAYFIDRPIPENSTLLLFDLGGGTLDVCIFKISNGELNIISRSGDPNLGGRDFDSILINYFKEKLKNNYEIILSKSKQFKLMQICQEAKETLTVTNEYLLDAEDFGASEDSYIPITKKQFEELSVKLLQKLHQNIEDSLKNAKCTKKDMNKVLYVGGGCRMPKVKELLREIFPHAEHCCEENPDEVVAIGAAYYANYLKCNPTTVNNKNLFVHYTVPPNITSSYYFPKNFLSFNDKIKAIGINFGEKNCYTAVTRKDEILTIPLNYNGSRQLPSYVAFDEEKEKCGKIVIKRLLNFAKSTVFDVQQFLGKDYEEININPKWPFKISTFNDKVKIQVQGPNGRMLSKYREEVCAVLLKHIKEKAEEFQDKNINETVITIPTLYTVEQKDALQASAALAGWKRIHLLEEPFAAAFAYFIHRPIPSNAYLLLFDLSYNSLKVYILQIQNYQGKILQSCEYISCGEKDFDAVLMEYFIKKLNENYNIKISENKRYKLEHKLQRIKHNLKMDTKDKLDVEEFDPSIKNSYIEITPELFQTMAHTLLDNIQLCLITALDKAELNSNEINKILYAGEGCQMSMIKNLLKETFENSEHYCDENPEEVFAIGAAYFAYHSKITFKNESRCSIN